MSQLQLLDPNGRRELLAVARLTIEQYLSKGKSPSISSVTAAFQENRGAFVTLHRGEELRGCIGTFDANTPLLDTVQRMAVAAATQDPRFTRVRLEELPDLKLEISVLSPLAPIAPEEIQIGRHGLYLSRGNNHGVLLPQVAVEHGWDRETFLTHTCVKAGLPRHAWREPDTLIEGFTADVFSEDTVE